MLKQGFKKIGLALFLGLAVVSFESKFEPAMAMGNTAESEKEFSITSTIASVQEVFRKAKGARGVSDQNSSEEQSLIILKPDFFMDVERAASKGEIDFTSAFKNWKTDSKLWRVDCVENAKWLCDELQKQGLHISSCSDLVLLDRELVEKHYEEHKQKPFFKSLVDYVCSAPVVVATVTGEGAVAKARDFASTEARSRFAPYDGALKKQCNAIHSSDSIKSAEREIENLSKYLVN